MTGADSEKGKMELQLSSLSLLLSLPPYPPLCHTHMHTNKRTHILTSLTILSHRNAWTWSHGHSIEGTQGKEFSEGKSGDPRFQPGGVDPGCTLKDLGLLL